MKQFDKYRMVDGVTPLAARYFNKVWQDIDLRLASLEEVKIAWQEAVDEVVRFGLVRIDELINEPLQAVVALSSQAESVSANLEQLRQLAESRTTALAQLIETLQADTAAQINAFIESARSDITAHKNATAAELTEWKAQRTAEITAWMDSFEQQLQAAGAAIDAQIDSLRRMRLERKAVSFLLQPADTGKVVEVTATATVTLPTADALGLGWCCTLRNTGSGLVTLQAAAGSQIDGLSSYIMYPGENRLLQCDGAVLNSSVITPMVLVKRTSFDFVKPPGYRAFEMDVRGATGGGGSGGAGGYANGGYHGSGGGGASGGIGARWTAMFPEWLLQALTSFDVGAAGLGGPGVESPPATGPGVVVSGVNGSEGGATVVTIDGVTFDAPGGAGGRAGVGSSGGSAGSGGIAAGSSAATLAGKYTTAQAANRYRYLAGIQFGTSNPGKAGAVANGGERVPGGAGGPAMSDSLASGITGAGGMGGPSRGGAIGSVSQPGLNGEPGMVIIKGVL